MINPPKLSPWYYQMIDYGWNYRASEISCALGLSQFKRITKIINKRNVIANLYKKNLLNNEFVVLLNLAKKKNDKGWHLFQLNISFEN